MACFEVVFFYETAPHSFYRPNGLFGAFRCKIVQNVKFARFLRKTTVKCHFPKKHVSFRLFLRNSTLTYFRSQMDYVARFEENFSRKKTSHFCIKHPRNCFSEWRVLRSYFFTKPPHNLFSGPNGICGTFRGKTVSYENFNHFYLKRPQNCFYEKHVFGPKFFTKLHPHLFSGPNGLCGSFQGKIVTEENSTRFCKKHPWNHFSKWRISRPYFFTKPPYNLFSGPNGICGTFQGKIVSHETSIIFT